MSMDKIIENIRKNLKEINSVADEILNHIEGQPDGKARNAESVLGVTTETFAQLMCELADIETMS